MTLGWPVSFCRHAQLLQCEAGELDRHQQVLAALEQPAFCTGTYRALVQLALRALKLPTSDIERTQIIAQEIDNLCRPDRPVEYGQRMAEAVRKLQSTRT